MASVFGFGLFSHDAFSSCSSLLFLSCASFPVRGFSAFGIFPKDLLFFLFRVRLYSFLIPHVNAFFLLMLTCGLIGFVVGAYRDSFSRNLYKRQCAHLFILPAKGTGKCPYRRSDSHALSDSLKSRMPIVRRTRTLYCLVVYLFSKFVFVFSKPRTLPKRGYFFAFKSLFHRFFSFALSLSFFRFSFRKIVFYVIIFHWILLGFLPYFIVFYEHMARIFAFSADI